MNSYLMVFLIMLLLNSTTFVLDVQHANGSLMQEFSYLDKEDIMEKASIVQKIKDIFECSDETAQSLYKTIEKVISDNISNVIEIPHDNYKVLKITSDSGKEFYAKIGKGYFIMKVHEDSMNGKIIYRAMK